MSVTPVASPLVDTYWMLAEFSAGTVFSHPEVTTCRIVNPAVCATGVVPSAPRVTVHVVPLTLVTAMISLPAPAATSTTWNWVGGIAVEDAAGNDGGGRDRPVLHRPAGGGVGATGGNGGGGQVGEDFSGHNQSPLLIVRRSRTGRMN